MCGCVMVCVRYGGSSVLVCDVDGCGHAQVAAPVCVCTCACVHVGPQTCTASRRLVVMVEEQERSLQSRR